MLDEPACGICIGLQLGNYRFDLDRRFVLSPAVVICHHPYKRVWQFRFPRELGLGHRGHADHISAPLAIKQAVAAALERTLAKLYSVVR